MVKNIPGLVQAWLGIFGIFGGPVLGLFTLGMFFPWAESSGALSGGILSLVFMLWISIGGNVSRLNGLIKYDEMPVSVEECPKTWNTTATGIEPGTANRLDWYGFLFPTN